MMEELSLYDNEMNYATTAYAVVNIIAIWPCNLLLTRTRPRWIIPFLEIGWTIVTFCHSAMTKDSLIYVARSILIYSRLSNSPR
ncbi:hypothetical protein BDW74DRAFT_31863 [Aspergillus multicolor]|uniref:uncharacterized protein n=1 Tax=Aspergillus multicolor TaxID=41759 RepID=UPI003CCDF059